ncbi:hypothetical protein C8Q77DRAFT_1076470 [Trametes polyzona]|nr:hypothetical protein C8Q77DRAFT_1076470 [Trametes polyzona]
MSTSPRSPVQEHPKSTVLSSNHSVQRRSNSTSISKNDSARNAVKAAAIVSKAKQRQNLQGLVAAATSRSSLVKCVPGPALDSKQVQAAWTWAHTAVPPTNRDEALGEALVRLIPRETGHIPNNRLFSQGVVLDAAGGKHNRQRCASMIYPLRFRVDHPPRSVVDYPIVFLDSSSVLFIDSVKTSIHGYGYMTAPDCAGLPELGMFHLYNRPGPTSVTIDKQTGNFFKDTIWHYCGLYVAHKTQYSLSKHTWDSLSELTKDEIATLHCSVLELNWQPGKVTPQHRAHWRERISAGQSPLPLVLFECVQLPMAYSALLSAKQGVHLMPTQKPPPPPMKSRAEIEAEDREAERRKAGRRPVATAAARGPKLVVPHSRVMPRDRTGERPITTEGWPFPYVLPRLPEGFEQA